MFEAREAIECGVAHIAARRASDADLAKLQALVRAADTARDGTDHLEFLRDDHEIHATLVHIVRNPLLQDAADRLLLHNLRFWRSYWSSRPAQHGVDGEPRRPHRRPARPATPRPPRGRCARTSRSSVQLLSASF